MYCCLNSLRVYRQINSYQPPSGYLSITRSASGGSARDLRRQQAQGVPEARKKAGFAPTGAVCRSCTTMPVSIRAPPSSEGKAKRLSRISSIRRRHLAGRVPRAKRLGRQRRNPHSGNLHTALNIEVKFIPAGIDGLFFPARGASALLMNRRKIKTTCLITFWS